MTETATVTATGSYDINDPAAGRVDVLQLELLRRQVPVESLVATGEEDGDQAFTTVEADSSCPRARLTRSRAGSRRARRAWTSRPPRPARRQRRSRGDRQVLDDSLEGQLRGFPSITEALVRRTPSRRAAAPTRRAPRSPRRTSTRRSRRSPPRSGPRSPRRCREARTPTSIARRPSCRAGDRGARRPRRHARPGVRARSAARLAVGRARRGDRRRRGAEAARQQVSADDLAPAQGMRSWTAAPPRSTIASSRRPTADGRRGRDHHQRHAASRSSTPRPSSPIDRRARSRTRRRRRSRTSARRPSSSGRTGSATVSRPWRWRDRDPGARAMRRAIGLDHGERRIGVAVGDTETRHGLCPARAPDAATSTTTWPWSASSWHHRGGRVCSIIGLAAQHGRPRGDPGGARPGVRRCAGAASVPRSSSRTSGSASWEADAQLRRRRAPSRIGASGELDSAAARLILQQYLDARRHRAGPRSSSR